MVSKEDYLKFMSEVRKVSGVDTLTPDETGLVSIRVDDAYNVNLQFVEATGKVLCFVEVTALPSGASKAVYHDLLVGGLFGKDTAGGYFAVEPESESVVYNYFFDLEEAAKKTEVPKTEVPGPVGGGGKVAQAHRFCRISTCPRPWSLKANLKKS